MKIENSKLKINKGFTLVEMLIAVSLFVVIAFISIGAILSIFDANKRAQSSKTVVDNLNLSIENMARTVRFGSNYNKVSDTELRVTFYDINLARTKIVAYRLNGTSIEVSDDGGSFMAITSPETVIEYLRFYVSGSSPFDANQPYVLAVIKGYSGNKPTTQSKFSIQTLMSQRTLDI